MAMTSPEISEDLRFPVGKFDRSVASPDRRAENIQTITELPKRIAEAVEGLTEGQLEKPYRPGGWTVRQTVHHIADSHMNSLCRFKLALTEDGPAIRPYFEDRWAELADSRLPVEVSLSLINALHARWSALLNAMSDADFARTLQHPESGEWTIEEMLALYAWHSLHHTAHITRLRERNDW
jgi:uncharacterized damage-inducible protein DinB